MSGGEVGREPPPLLCEEGLVGAAGSGTPCLPSISRASASCSDSSSTSSALAEARAAAAHPQTSCWLIQRMPP
jgi:hypothetical protein